MGVTASRIVALDEIDWRGVNGFLEDIDTVNRLAPCFRYDGSQLVFINMSDSYIDDENFHMIAKVGVKRVRINADDAIDECVLLSRNRESCKVLSYRSFCSVLRRMQSDAEVAMQVQMTLRGCKAKEVLAHKVLLNGGRLVSMAEACSLGLCKASESPFEPAIPLINNDPQEGFCLGVSEASPANVVNGITIQKENDPSLDSLHEENDGQGPFQNSSHSPTETVDIADFGPQDSRGNADEDEYEDCVSEDAGTTTSLRSEPKVGKHKLGSKDYVSEDRGGGRRPLETNGEVVKVEEFECMICLQMTRSGVTLPCFHGPFCEGCITVWVLVVNIVGLGLMSSEPTIFGRSSCWAEEKSDGAQALPRYWKKRARVGGSRSRRNRSCPACRMQTGYDDSDCWVLLEEPSLGELVEGLYDLIRQL